MVSLLGLRARLVRLMVVALLPVLGLVAWAAASKQSDALKIARSTLQSQALLTAASQQPQVEAVKQLLGDLASAPSVKGRLPGLCSEYLRNLQAMHPQYTDLGVVALDGTVLCHSEAAMVGADAGARPFFKRVMASRQFSIGNARCNGQSACSGEAMSRCPVRCATRPSTTRHLRPHCGQKIYRALPLRFARASLPYL